MKRSAKLILAGMLALTTLSGSAWACGQSCWQGGGPNLSVPQGNNVRPQPLPPSPGLAANDVIVNDLPVDAKRAIRAAAAKVRTNTGVRQPVRTAR